MSDVQVSVETGVGLERRLRVRVPAGQIDEEVETRLRSAGRTAKVKGFRPGKVPVEVIRRRFGPQIRQEVLQDVVRSSYAEAITRENLRPAGNPRFEVDAQGAEQGFVYTAVFEVVPEFRVDGLDQLSVERPEAQITDADIDSTVQKLQRQKGGWSAVARQSATGDRVVVDFEGARNGSPIEGGKAERLGIVLGEGRMLADFEGNLEGLAAGDEKAFTVRFPDDYPNAALRGENVEFQVKVHEVAAQDLPAVDQEFVRGFGVASGEPEEFRGLVRENLEREAAAKIHADVRRQILEQLLASNPVDLPLVMVSREAADLQAETMRNLGIKDVKQAPALSSFEEVARRRVRIGLIMGALIREHDLKPDPAEVDKKLAELCRPYDRPDEVRALYLQNPELMSQVRSSVLEAQVMAWLASRSSARPKPMPFAELMEA